MNLSLRSLATVLAIITITCAIQAVGQTRYADSVLAFSSEYSTTDWSEDQILGPPDTYPQYGDIGTAWSPATEDDQREFIELRFPNPAKVQSVAVWETYNPGAIDTIYVKNPNTGQWQIVWQGTAAPLDTPYARIFTVNFPQTSFNVTDIRLAINSPAVPGWNEYDAVAISATPFSPQLPDLIVPLVQAPSQAISGQTISVSWNVKNIGTTGTSSNVWVDRLYLMSTTTFDPGVAVLNQTFDNFSSLNPGQSYTQTESITLPLGLSGNYYFFVSTNDNHQVAESTTVNNLGRSTPILMHLSPEPDLAVTSLNVPTTVFAGDSINVSFVVKNIGSAATSSESGWSDLIVISQDTSTVAADVLSGQVLASIDQGGVLSPDSSYHVSKSVVIPHDVYGKWYIFAFTDANNNIFENYLEANNVRRSDSVNVISVPPDIMVSSITVPSSAGSGSSIPIQWSVRNQGPGITVETFWQDRVYLSPDSIYNDQDAITLGIYDHNGALRVDSTYRAAASVVIPNGLSGPYFIYVMTDYDSVVFETGTRGNNLRRSNSAILVTLSPWPDLQVTNVHVLSAAKAGQAVTLKWTVRNAGAGSTPGVIWNDEVYISSDSEWNGSANLLVEVPHNSVLPPAASYTDTTTVVIPPTVHGIAYFYIFTDGDDVVFENTDENNNVTRSDSVIVQSYPSIDLAVTSFTIPDSGISGQTVNLHWTVKNIGAGKTITDRWDDFLYLTTDTILNTDTDILVDQVTHDGTLDPGSNYSRDIPEIIPPNISGHYRWFIVTDANGVSGDTAMGNNVRISSKSMTIKLLPPPDLTVTSIVLDDSIFAGQPATVRWTIKNASAGPVNNSSWTDAIYISTVGYIDYRAQKLETVVHDDLVGPNSSYSDSIQVTIPQTATGQNYILVQADSRNDVAETNENNNLLSVSCVILLAAPCDLIITDASFPDSAEPGNYITVSYTISNQGINPAVGYLTDAIYLSSDSAWQSSDALLGTNADYVNLYPGTKAKKTMRIPLAVIRRQDMSNIIQGELPGILPGSYHIIIQTDILDNIRETNKTNNTFVSPATMNVQVTQLQQNVVENGTVSQDQSEYYSFTALGGEDFSVKLSCASQDGLNELFVRYGNMPSRGLYDYLYQNPNSTSQNITISSATAGTYYVMVHGANVPVDSTGFSIVVKPLQFAIDSVRYAAAGNGGEVTFEILGAKFKQGAHAQLRRSGQASVDDNSDYLVSSTQFNARFSTAGLVPGLYDIVVINPDLQVAVLSGGVTIQPGNPVQLQVSIDGPSKVKINSFETVFLSITNPTNLNIQRAAIFLSVRQQMRFSVEVDEGIFDSNAFVQSADSLVDAQGNRILQIYIYNMAPGRTRTVRMFAEALDTGRYIMTAQTFVLDRTTFDSLLVVSVREGIQQGWISATSIGSASRGFLGKSTSASATTDGCPYDDPGVCDAWNNRQRNADIANDAQGVVVSGAKASGVITPNAGGLYKIGKFFYDLMNFFNKYKNSSGYAADEVASHDPNDILGPPGYGDNRWVSVSQTLPYTILFENDPNQATAPAQAVGISMNLDSTLDASSFRLMGFGFAGRSFPNATGKTYYTERLDVRDSLGIFVDVTAGVDIVHNKIFWSFSSVDPNTGALPANPLVGMLPVDDSLHHGEGFVSYTIRPKSTSKTRDIIAPKASIVFDVNAPLATPNIMNMIDAGIPLSSVRALPSNTNSTAINVHWGGVDDSIGSGIRDYTVYLSRNDSAWQTWQTNITDTSARLTVVSGNQYRFFSIASDNAGNVEPIKNSPDALTMVTGVKNTRNTLPTTFALDQNYPNPFNPVTTLRYQIPIASKVTLKIYNILGQVVTTLTDGVQNAGYKSVSWNAAGFASGVYFYRIDASSISNPGKRFTQVKKMLLLK